MVLGCQQQRLRTSDVCWHPVDKGEWPKFYYEMEIGEEEGSSETLGLRDIVGR